MSLQLSPSALTALVVAMSIGLWVRPAVAQESEEVEALIHQGVQQRKQGLDERALPIFQKAYHLARTPRTAAQLGLVEMALGYWVGSERHLMEALASPDHPWIIKQHDLLQGALTKVRENIAEVTVTGSPPAASVWINAKEVGKLPLSQPLRLPKGPIDLEVRAAGYSTATRSMVIGGGAPLRISIDLQKEANATVAPPVPEPIVRRPVISQPLEVLPPASPIPASSNPWRMAGWITAALAGASLVFAVVETVTWTSKRSEFDNHRSQPADPTQTDMSKWPHDCGADDPMHGGPACAAIYNSLSSARTLAIVGYTAGGALAIGATFALLRSGRHQPEQKIACAPAFQGLGLRCRVSF
jgi:hypothetical protein